MSYYHDVYQIVAQIPAGRVSTYGHIARLNPIPRGARGVGWALRALHPAQARHVPWWRVVNAQGRISNPFNATLQRTLLEAEGIRFGADDCIDLEQYLWDG